MTTTYAESPLTDVLLGVGAGIAGTIAKDGLQKLSAAAGGDSGADESPSSWDEASAPAQVGRRFVEGVFQHEVPIEQHDKVMWATHLGYGATWGVIYGVVEASVKPRTMLHGLLFGSIVWSSAYVILPAANLYKPIWKYPPKTLAKDLSYHLVYGLGVALAFSAARRVLR